ncbi:hypothetical protein L596_028187 [Steinernema carpocapsae]|uniref:non-specific serine/threonine protein kinase n=1 Tax=Steinernema carpocapsae TaxID=34508 RepID=A0A4U5LXR9_STECR|nr:hypothetical protein L596_028187 [Steinernema carpocapsae]
MISAAPSYMDCAASTSFSIPSTSEECLTEGLTPQNVELGGLHYSRRSKLAEGGFSSVYCMASQDGSKRIAMKASLIEDESALEYWNDEVKIMQRLNHPNIVTLLQTFVSECVDQGLIFMELAPFGSLYDCIKNDAVKVDIFRTRAFFHQMASAVSYMHKVGIAHRDLKASNVLIMDPDNVKLCDFGLSSTIRFSAEGVEVPDENFSGTDQFSSPMKLQEKTTLASKDDVWALALILFFMHKHCFPWALASPKDADYEVWASSNTLPEDFESLPENVKLLMEMMLEPLESNRWSMDDVLRSTYCRFESDAPFTIEIVVHEAGTCVEYRGIKELLYDEFGTPFGLYDDPNYGELTQDLQNLDVQQEAACEAEEEMIDILSF